MRRSSITQLLNDTAPIGMSREVHRRMARTGTAALCSTRCRIESVRWRGSPVRMPSRAGLSAIFRTQSSVKLFIPGDQGQMNTGEIVARWSGNKRVQEKAKKALYRAHNLKTMAQDEIEATRLLYQQDDVGHLQPEGARERTYFMTQQKLGASVSLQSNNKMFSLELDGGPYILDYTRNGRFLLVGGEAGQFASFDWQAGRLSSQVDLCASGESERIQDVCFLQNETMFAVAQANYVYIYDGAGIELHRLKKHARVRSIEYLPYHFLLGSVSDDLYIRWQDITSGKLAAEWRFPEGVGQPISMAQNPWNGILNTSHANGTVSFWSPNLNKPLVRMNCHKGPVRALAMNSTGNVLASAGLDGVVKTWDLRNSYRCLGEYRSMRPATSLSFSQKNLLAVSFGAHVAIWKDVVGQEQPDRPYMRHVEEGHTIRRIAFCPYEDVLGIGHSGGISSVLIPGAGEPNYDVYEANPFAGRKQRQEREVHALLDKLPMESISLDGGQFIGKVAVSAEASIAADRAAQGTANGAAKEKKRARGRSSAMKRYMRKRVNVIDKYKTDAAEKARSETIHRDLNIGDNSKDGSGLSALNRFVARSI